MLSQWIEQLDAADFETRETACGKLAATGKAAVPALEKAAANGNLEVLSRATRALGTVAEIVRRDHAEGGRRVLHHLANGHRPTAASRAQSILDHKNGFRDNGRGVNGEVVIRRGIRGRRLGNGVLEIPASPPAEICNFRATLFPPIRFSR